MENIKYNEYQIKMLLMRDDIDFTKFNKLELIDFLKVASKEIKIAKDKIEKAIKYIKENSVFYSGMDYTDREIGLFEDDINDILKILGEQR